MTNIINLLPCPFCGHAHPVDDQMDVIYPTGAWREIDYGYGDVYITYFPYYQREPTDGLVWSIHCVECSGGCGASIDGHSKEEVIKKWNTRVDKS